MARQADGTTEQRGEWPDRQMVLPSREVGGQT